MGARLIQVLGTNSDAGKSTIAMCLCRYLSDKGYRVAPFKSVNMSLNSISIEGGYEIARAQWVQAKAARTDPLKEMNPFLLKPEGNGRSQVIQNGLSLGSMSYEQYSQHLAANAPRVIRGALEYLLSNFDLVVAEGAGSPAEINLAEKDFANSFVSGLYNAPSILVADIDRGGVFASIYGTIKLMTRSDLVKGVVINKMRGDKEILKPGILKIEELTGKRIIGVMPYLDNVLPGEDSLNYSNPKVNSSEIAVISYPHMENYSDIDPLYAAGIGITMARRRADISDDVKVIILPGSKDVESDLKYLFTTGLADKIISSARKGVKILGICGGYQMLGTRIRDEKGVEMRSGEMHGIGLIPCETTYSDRKTVRPVKYRTLVDKDTGEHLGYEIHYGEVSGKADPLNQSELGPEGSVLGNVMGTNIHGILENPIFLRYLTGISISEDFRAVLEKNIEHMTEAFIESVDVRFIDEILNGR
ncbi:cobyric acid synthase [Thermoplasmatales archaeon AK]|nr:cobyric acid synthase [Thermoplasmatales archaeon AK]